MAPYLYEDVQVPLLPPPLKFAPVIIIYIMINAFQLLEPLRIGGRVNTNYIILIISFRFKILTL